jgi:folate-dependent phosphoribosylglycinamide formyltransferase PurN
MADTNKSTVSLTFGHELTDAEVAKLQTASNALTIVRGTSVHLHHDHVDGGPVVRTAE